MEMGVVMEPERILRYNHFFYKNFFFKDIESKNELKLSLNSLKKINHY